MRELGIEKFGQTLFCTDAEEVLDPKQWTERAGAQDGTVDVDLLSREERELQGVRRAEEEERHGTAGRDLMGAGGSGGTPSGSSSGLKMKSTDDARSALSSLNQSDDGTMVQLGIDLPTETLTLISSATSVSSSALSSRIPADKPSYTFYQYPASDSVVFIYTCPGGSKIKERMLYASSRAFVLQIAKAEGVVVNKRIEAGSPEEVGEDRLKDEVEPKAEEGPPKSGGFARPKRPGRR